MLASPWLVQALPITGDRQGPHRPTAPPSRLPVMIPSGCSPTSWSASLGAAFPPIIMMLPSMCLSSTFSENGKAISLGRGNLLTHAASSEVSSVTLNPSCSRRRTDCRAMAEYSRSSK